jgi:hypothetical protein
MTVFPQSGGNNLIYAIRLTYDHTLEYRYVGQTSRGVLRLQQHISDARNLGSGKYDTHKSYWIRKHNFCITFDILEELSDSTDLNFAEMKWIHILRTKGYDLINQTDGGDGVRGYVVSEDTREKMRQAKLGKPRTDETKAKISAFNKGKTIPDSQRKQLSISYSGEGNPMFGKSAWNSGKRMEDLIDNYQHPFKGKTLTPDHREKLSLAHKGKPNRGRHTRWHEQRNLIVDDCIFCIQ